MCRKHCGKRRNCLLRAISPFPTVFLKGLFPKGVKRRHCVGMGQYVLILNHTILKKKALENTMGKEENAGDQHFLLFPQCFQLYLETLMKKNCHFSNKKKKKTVISATFYLLSANTLRYFISKNLSFGLGLIMIVLTLYLFTFDCLPIFTQYVLNMIF